MTYYQILIDTNSDWKILLGTTHLPKQNDGLIQIQTENCFPRTTHPKYKNILRDRKRRTVCSVMNQTPVLYGGKDIPLFCPDPVQGGVVSHLDLDLGVPSTKPEPGQGGTPLYTDGHYLHASFGMQTVKIIPSTNKKVSQRDCKRCTAHGVASSGGTACPVCGGYALYYGVPLS